MIERASRRGQVVGTVWYDSDAGARNAVMAYDLVGGGLGRANDGAGPARCMPFRGEKVTSLERVDGAREVTGIVDVADEIMHGDDTGAGESNRCRVERRMQHVETPLSHPSGEEQVLPRKPQRPQLTFGRQTAHDLREPFPGGKQPRVAAVDEQEVVMGIG